MRDKTVLQQLVVQNFDRLVATVDVARPAEQTQGPDVRLDVVQVSRKRHMEEGGYQYRLGWCLSADGWIAWGCPQCCP